MEAEVACAIHTSPLGGGKNQCKHSRKNNYYDSFVKLVQTHHGSVLFSPRIISSKKERLPVKCEEGHSFLITYVTLEKNRFCLQCHNKDKARWREECDRRRAQMEGMRLYMQEQQLLRERERMVHSCRFLNLFSVPQDILSSFTTLGIEPTLAENEVRAAYHNLALRYHPDKTLFVDGETRFKDIVSAKDTILTFLKNQSLCVN
ncbi:hypothetical protein WA556_006803 [Blastocystis sp. ATCC 50177/Nand II]